MTESELKTTCREIFQHLSEKKVKQAFALIRKLVSDSRQGEYSDKIYDLEENYYYIRKYTVEGVEDPERGKIYRHLVSSLLELTVKIRESWLATHSGSLFYRKKRAPEFLLFPDPERFVHDLVLLQKGDAGDEKPDSRQKINRISTRYWQKIIRTFYRIVLIDQPGEVEKAFVTSLLQHPEVQAESKSVLVTALTFSLLRYFDVAKMELLLDICDRNREIPMLSQRSLTGFLVAFYHYESLMEFYPATVARFEMMNEDSSFHRNVERIMLQLLGSRETEKIKQKIQEEIIPEMIRISPNIRNKFNIDTLMGSESPDDLNPEWSTLFRDSPGLFDKMEEMARMQTEGADVFLASFGLFKRFPFFDELVNWFVPFFPGHPDIPGLMAEDPEDNATRITEALLRSPMLCDSDKYSFTLMLQTLAGEARTMMAGFLQAEVEQLEELAKDEEMLSPDRKEGLVSNKYIQDLYRFYRLHPSKNDFEDIFSLKFDFHNKPLFRRIMEEHPGMVGKLAEFYFEKGYYEESLEIFGVMGDQNGESLQKAAWCHQKLGHYEKALSLYRKAELFEVNKIWNLKKIALCYRNLKLPEKALEVYQTLDSLEPDNTGTLYAMGYCYSETGQYQDALNAFFKIEYLSPGNQKVWRPIAWCSFLTGKTDQAERYYRKLTEDQPDKYDLMNMGHVQWALGKRVSALDYYLLSIRSGGFSEPEFTAAFAEDLRFLLQRGISREEVPLMLDQLRYSLEL